MNKIVMIDSKIPWKIVLSDAGYVGICSRLGLHVTANSMQELVDSATKLMYNIFKEQYEKQQLNEFAFKYSITCKVKDYEGFIDLTVPVILGD